jgi:DNA-directed RNA polymerase subunit RPC12/RpoP
VYVGAPTTPSAAGHHGALTILCRHCGAERLIPLSFTVPDATDRASELPEPPFMKCVECGKRLYPGDIVESPEEEG